MSRRRLSVFWLLALAFSALASCLAGAQAALAESPMLLAVDPQPLTVQTADGEKRFSIEIAGQPDERARGLMFRQDMPDDRGMLFVFERTQEVGFWMKNTPMPLDLVFIGEDGRVRAVLPGEPFSEAVITPGSPVRFVLELKAGIAGRNHIEPGDRMHHPAIDRALQRPNPG